MRIRDISSTAAGLVDNLRNNAFVRNGFSYTLSSFAMGVLSYFFNVFVARSFALELYGEYASALAYIAFFSVPLTAFTAVVIRKVGAIPLPERSQYARRLFTGLLQAAKLHGFWVLSGAAVGVIGLIQVANVTFLSSLFIVLMTVLAYVSSYCLAVLQAKKDFDRAGLFLIVSSGLKLCIGGLSLIWLAALPVLYAALLVVTGLSLWFGLRLALPARAQASVQTPRFSLSRILRTQSVVVPLISAVGMIGLINIDVMMAKIVLSPDDAGLYAGLSLLGKIVYYLSSPVISVAYTFFIDAGTEAKRRIFLLISASAMALAGAGATALYALLHDQLVALVFDERYLAIAPYAVLAGIFGGLFALVALLTQFYMAKLSRVSWLPVFACIAQVVFIALLPHTITAIIICNIVLVATLVLAYGAVFLLESRQDRI